VQLSPQGCAPGRIGKLEHGRVVAVSVGGRPLQGNVVAASKSRLLLLDYKGCGGRVSLASYNPSARSIRTFLKPPGNGLGFTGAVAYYTPDGQI
jgi:hypothetical protein